MNSIFTSILNYSTSIRILFTIKQNSEQILKELGYESETIQNLIDQAII